MRVPFQLRLCLLALSLGGVGSAQVLINEVLYRLDSKNSDPLKTQQWVELFNRGANPVNLAGWAVSGRDGRAGASARRLPSVSIPGGGYLVVHFATGTDRLSFSDGTADTYTQDTGPVWSIDMDEAALYSPDKIVDFIAWADTAVPYAPGAAHNDAVAAGIWTPNTSLATDGITVLPFEIPRPVALGMSIGRDPDSTDTDTTSDFEPHGGVGALDNSPNRQNSDRITFNEVDPPTVGGTTSAKASAPQRKRWTVLLFVNGDNNLEYYWYKKVRQVQETGGSDANINFVLMYDGKRFSKGTQRGLIGADDPTKLTLEHPPGESIQLDEQDMCDPATLSTFISWAKTNYPADRYALFLNSHGDGWKEFGPDETSRGTHDFDWMYMGELRTALTGQHFDLMVFDMCLMAGIEVADQVRDFTDYMVASEEIGWTFPYYDLLATALKDNPDWTGLDLGKSVVASYSNYAQRAYTTVIPRWTVSLIDEQRLIELIQQVDAWSTLLRTGVGLLQQRDQPADNVQIRIAMDLAASQVYTDPNFVDLFDLAQHIQNDAGIPACIKGPIPNILTLINGQVVVAEQHFGVRGNGLHIYFPKNRKRTMTQFFDNDYDLPETRRSDGSSMLEIYARNHDQLPLLARDQEDFTPLSSDDWPEPPTPQLVFVQHTSWSRFLERYYHPVADNHILGGVTPDGSIILPTQLGGGACANPTDQITVPVGTTVHLSGAGSSDGDQPPVQPVPNIPPVPSFFPSYYFWDMDASSIGCLPKCVQPTEVTPGSDAALNATDNMDADRDLNNTTWDEKDAEGVAVTRVCETAGTFVVTLMVWDNNHLMPFHDTVPSALYVHPQTDSQQSIITCTAQPFTLLIDDPPPGITVNQDVFLLGIVKAAVGITGAGAASAPAGRAALRAAAASAPAPSLSNYPLLISTSSGTPPVSASGTTIPPGGSATISSDISGVFTLEFKPAAAGPGQITVKALGGPSQTISFTVSPALAVTDLSVVSAPAGGQIATGQQSSIRVQVSNHGQPVANVPVNFEAAFGNVAFLSGTSFARGLGAQATTDSSGMAQVGLQGLTQGAEQILITAGPIGGALNLKVTGTPPSIPTGVGVLNAPSLVDVAQQATVVAVAVAGPNPFPGAAITFQVVQGNVSFTGSPIAKQITVTTDSTGQASATFAANDPTPVQLRVSVVNTQLSATVSIPVRLPLNLETPPTGTTSIAAVTNAASGATSSIAPGEIVTLYGSGLGPANLTYFQLVEGTIPTGLGGTQILFNGIPAPLIYVRQDQVAAIVPFDIAAFGQTTAAVQVELNGSISPPFTVPITNTMPGLYSANQSGSGSGAIQNSDGSYNTAANPAAVGSVIVLYVSGLGPVNPSESDGTLTPTSDVPALEFPATATIGGQLAQIVYQGPAPGAVAGLYQINCVIPSGVGSGNAAVVVTADGRQSQANLTVAVK
jgi:uncharacterized protein (TIGR03437 family)